MSEIFIHKVGLHVVVQNTHFIKLLTTYSV